MNAAMNAAAASPSSARLGAPLLELAARILPELPAELAGSGAAAVRAFVDAPSPAAFLAATRALHDARRAYKLAALGRTAGPRRTERGVALLARVAEIPPAVLEALASLPADARNGRRLQVIAELFGLFRVLTARAEAGLRHLQASLGAPPLPPLSSKRRRARATPRTP